MENSFKQSAIEQLRRKDGTTLIETFVAVLIFGISVAGICGLVGAAKELGDRSRGHYTAVNIAKNRLERIHIFDYSQLYLFAENNTTVDRNGVADPEGDYRRTTTISTVSSNLSEVVIRVAIKNRVTCGFGSEEETVQSYVADILMGDGEDS